MPQSALENVPDAHVAAAEGIPKVLMRLIEEELPPRLPVNELRSSEKMEAIKETKIAEFDMGEIENEMRAGRPSPFACPDCGGVLWEIDQAGFLRFRCRVGHAFTAKHLGAEQRHAVETALWAGLRALEESAALYRRMSERAARGLYGAPARLYEERAENTEVNSRTLREFLLSVSKDSVMVSETDGSRDGEAEPLG
jgi:two-component system chemotaxis response regulator CheB